MTHHANIKNDEITIPYYAVHKDGVIAGFFKEFSFLSNFYILENGIWFDELTYPSVEHCYQAAKWPQNMREQFLNVTARESKKLGKHAPKFDGKKWNKKKVDIMSALCRQKFDKNDKLRKMLEMTEDCLLEERNSWGDIEWGTNERGEGKNMLGVILMTIRDDFRMIEKKESW